ncbi:MAG TPA: lipopolysaccharide heptosyltransferase II [Pirellulales bacterium]|nr:lipopolysaccharide heptosyltransferase II [Pirellulales bacterium]
MKIAVFLPNWVGDAVMATPTLRALRNHYSSAKLTGVMRPAIAETLAGLPWLDEVVLFDPRATDHSIRSLPLLRRLRADRPDMAVLLPNSLRAGILGWLSGASRRVGYAQYGRGPLLTDKSKRKKVGRRFAPTPTMDCYLKLAYLLGCPAEPPRTELRTLSEDEAAADRVWQQLELPPGNEVVVVNTGAAYGAAKNWPVDHIVELSLQLVRQRNMAILIICGPQERQTALEITSRTNHPRIKCLADQTVSIGLSKACIRRSRLLISTDSGPRHFAAAFDVPVVTLYGPTDIAWGDTRYRHAVHLQHDVPCGPCMKRICPLQHHRCMQDLSVQRVFHAVEELLAKTDAERAVA